MKLEHINTLLNSINNNKKTIASRAEFYEKINNEIQEFDIFSASFTKDTLLYCNDVTICSILKIICPQISAVELQLLLSEYSSSYKTITFEEFLERLAKI